MVPPAFPLYGNENLYDMLSDHTRNSVEARDPRYDMYPFFLSARVALLPLMVDQTHILHARMTWRAPKHTLASNVGFFGS